MVLLPLSYGAETTHIWCYHHSNFNFSKVSIWHYDHSNMAIPPFPLFDFSSIKILKEYLYTIKIILNFDGTLRDIKKEMKRRKTRQHKSRKGEERKSSQQLNETLWCIFLTEWSPLFI